MNVFVYGSLRKGKGNHRLLDGCPFVGRATTEPAYTMLNLGAFPGVVPVGSTAIEGEVYDVDEGTMFDLDMLEGHPTFYKREQRSILMDAVWHSAWIYMLGDEWLDGQMAVVDSGDWLNR